MSKSVLRAHLARAALRHAQSNKTLFIVIDDAHFLAVEILRRLRFLFERFPKKHNLELLGIELDNDFVVNGDECHFM